MPIRWFADSVDVGMQGTVVNPGTPRRALGLVAITRLATGAARNTCWPDLAWSYSSVAVAHTNGALGQPSR